MRKCLLTLFTIFFAAASVGASDFFFDSSLGYVFDNHEFDSSSNKYLPSGTIHYGRFTPYVGWNCINEEKIAGRVVFGMDLIKQAGSSISTLSGMLADVPMYFMVSYKLPSAQLVGIVGSYPRNYIRGDYGELVFSEETVETDFNLDGMYVGYRKNNFFCETALDWMGKRGNESHERFQILSYGSYTLSPLIDLGWSGSFYHFAGSTQAPGVVDNHLFLPFVKLNFISGVPLDEFSVKIRGLLSYQKLRVEDDLRLPYGCEAELLIRKGSFGLNNLASLSKDFLPFYDSTDSTGEVYGGDLYRGSLFYRKGFYNRVEFYWAPQFYWKINFKVSCRLHFNSTDGFLGWEQRVALFYNF